MAVYRLHIEGEGLLEKSLQVETLAADPNSNTGIVGVGMYALSSTFVDGQEMLQAVHVKLDGTVNLLRGMAHSNGKGVSLTESLPISEEEPIRIVMGGQIHPYASPKALDIFVFQKDDTESPVLA